MFSKILFGGFWRERNWNSCLIFGRIELSIKYWVLILKCFPKSLFRKTCFELTNKNKRKKSLGPIWSNELVSRLVYTNYASEKIQSFSRTTFQYFLVARISFYEALQSGVKYFLNLKLFVVGGCGECTTKFKW